MIINDLANFLKSIIMNKKNYYLKNTHFLDDYVSDYPDRQAFDANKRLINEVEDHFRGHLSDPVARKMLANIIAYRRFIANALNAYNMDCDYLFECAFKVVNDYYSGTVLQKGDLSILKNSDITKSLMSKAKTIFESDYKGMFRYVYEPISEDLYSKSKIYINQ